jgi:hypothetical protein
LIKKNNGLKVQLPQEEDILQNLFQLINEAKILDAISMISLKITAGP